MHRRWPEYQIDHIDRDKLNNQIANLREATHSQNMFNKWERHRNTSGIRGVLKRGKKWRALIGHNGQMFYLGSFNTAAEAQFAYAKAAKERFGEFACQI